MDGVTLKSQTLHCFFVALPAGGSKPSLVVVHPCLIYSVRNAAWCNALVKNHTAVPVPSNADLLGGIVLQQWISFAVHCVWFSRVLGVKTFDSVHRAFKRVTFRVSNRCATHDVHEAELKTGCVDRALKLKVLTRWRDTWRISECLSSALWSTKPFLKGKRGDEVQFMYFDFTSLRKGLTSCDFERSDICCLCCLCRFDRSLALVCVEKTFQASDGRPGNGVG